MKKVCLILLCLLMALFLSGCHIHIDTDPWPASPDTVEPETAITQEPVAFQTVTPPPLTTAVPRQPEGTVTPVNEDLVPVVTPTLPPSDEVVEPGFNG